MSSARNHRIRSHRSYKNGYSAMKHMKVQGEIRSNTKSIFRMNNIVEKFKNLFKRNKSK